MEEYETLSCVRGYHEYHKSVDSALGMAAELDGGSSGEVWEELRCGRERPRNPTDPYAVAIKRMVSQLAKARGKFRRKMFNVVYNQPA